MPRDIRPNRPPVDDAEEVDDETGLPDPEYYPPPPWLAEAVEQVLREQEKPREAQ